MATITVYLNWLHAVIGAIYVYIAVKLYRKRASRKHRICLGVSLSLEAHFICVLLHKSIHELFCGPLELYLNRTEDYKTCTYNVDNPWVMGVDQIAVSGIFLWALAYLTEILCSVEMVGRRKKLIRRARTAVILIEILCGILAVFKIVPWAMLLSVGITTLWVAIMFILSLKAFVKLRLRKTEQQRLTADLLFRSLVYLTVITLYWICWKWLKIIPRQAAESLYHVVVWIPLVPGLAKIRSFSTWRITSHMTSSTFAKVNRSQGSRAASAKETSRRQTFTAPKAMSKSTVVPE